MVRADSGPRQTLPRRAAPYPNHRRHLNRYASHPEQDPNSGMRNLSPLELKPLLEAGSVVLIDVRQAEELAIASVPGALHIPLNELPARLGELPKDRPLVAMCHHGVRSEMAGRLLERSGYTDVAHLVGGIDAWSQQIDPAVPRY